MVIDFSKVDIHEQPVLILKNTSGVPLGTLGAASNVIADIKYNEVSALDFNLPAYTDGVEVPNYNSVVGMRIIDLQDMGQFILMNPKETGNGVKRVKTCKAYSLEYEFTFKKITLQNGTYNFWNPVAPDDTILGIILDLMPSWSVGTVDSSLIGKYRTYEVSEENLYNFIKNTLQQSYSCIFDFDTYNRVINVKDPVDGTIKNVSALEFNRSSAVWFDSDNKARYWVLFDGSTADATLLSSGELDEAKTIESNTSITIAAETLSITLTDYQPTSA